MKTYLTTIYDSRKSFYNKALLSDTEKENTISLFSYETLVAEFTTDGKHKILKVYGYFSPTTARHINEFAQQNGFDKMTKKEMNRKPIIKY